MKIRLLNLDRSPDRLAEFVQRNPQMETHYTRVAAIDGAFADTQRLIANEVMVPGLKYTKGALGAALSHMVQWRDAIQNDTALTILEDDVVLAGNFVAETERLINLLPENWEYVSWGWGFDALMTFQLLPGYSHCTSSFDQDSLRKNSQHFSTEQVDSRLFRLKAGFGLIGYSISPRGARRFLDFCMPLRSMSLHYPGYPGPLPNTGVDNMMAQLYPNMGAYVAIPPLVVTNNYHATSTVQTYHVQSSIISTAAPQQSSRAICETTRGEPLAQKVTKSLAKQNLPSATKCTEFVLVSQHRTILTADAERGLLQHSSVDKSSLNICLTLADGVAHSVEEIAFEVLGEELVLQRVGDVWVLHQNGNFAIMRADGSVAFERQAENDSLLHLISAESVRLISPSAEQVARSESSTRRRLMLIVPHLVVGGADKVNLDLVTELKADFEITLVATQEGGPWMPRFKAQAERLVLLGQLMPPQLQPAALAFLILRLGIDCVLVSNSQGGYQSLPFLRQHFPRLPMFDLLHGQGGKLDGGGFPRFSMAFDQFLTGRIMITDYLRDIMISSYGLAPHRITRIYNGVDLRHFAPVTQEQSTPPIVSYIGRLAHEKHPEHVLAVARELTPTASCRFKIAGDGPLHAALAELLTRDPPCHPVEMSGYVDDVRELLADTYVLLLTSEMEGLPIVVLEAMAMGIPVICSAVGGLPEMIRDGIDGFLVPYGPDFAADAAKRLEQLLADPDRKARMGRSARERAEELFDMRVMMDSYRTLLTNAVTTRARTYAEAAQRPFGRARRAGKLTQATRRVASSSVLEDLRFGPAFAGRLEYRRTQFQGGLNAMTIKFHRIWFGTSAIPVCYQEYWRSWQRQYPDCDFITWTDSDLDSLDLTKSALDKLRSPTCRADLARYEILYKFGGIYLDCDIMPYNHFELSDIVNQLTVCNETDSTDYCSIGFVGSPKQHPIFLQLIEEILHSDIDESRPNVETGPWLFGRHLKNHPHRRLPTMAFYPYLYNEAFSSIRKKELDNTFGIHVWGGAWLPPDLKKSKALELLNKGDLVDPLTILEGFEDEFADNIKSAIEVIQDVRTKSVEIALFLSQSLSLDMEERRAFDFSKVTHWLLGQNRDRLVWQIGAADGILVDPLRMVMVNFDPPAILLEPNPYLFRMLQATYRNNHNATLLQFAYSTNDDELVLNAIDPEKVAELDLPRWVLGLSSVYDDKNAIGGLTISPATTKLIQSCIERIRVPVTGFAALVSHAGGRGPDIVVIDAEGMDKAIIEDLLQHECRPLVIHFEIQCIGEAEREELLTKLVEDYTLFEFGNDVTAYRNDLAMDYARWIYIHNGLPTMFAPALKVLNGLVP